MSTEDASSSSSGGGRAASRAFKNDDDEVFHFISFPSATKINKIILYRIAFQIFFTLSMKFSKEVNCFFTTQMDIKQ
jgi:hypothetical protein